MARVSFIIWLSLLLAANKAVIAGGPAPDDKALAVRSDNILKMVLRYGASGMDETRVEFNQDATVGFDNLYDANKPGSAPGVPTLYTHLYTNLWYGINTLPPLTTVTTVPMGLRPDLNTTMTLTPEGIQTFDPTSYLFLQDKKANVWKNLREGAYSFTTSTVDNQDRFVLHFTPPAIITSVNATCTLPGSIQIQQPGSASWNYSLLDSNSQSISSGTLNATSPVSLTVGAGVYMLVLSDQNGYTVMKSIQVNSPALPNAVFTVDTLTAEVGHPINFAPSVGNYSSYLWNFGDDSSSQNVATFHSYENEGIYPVQLTVTDSAGCQATAQVQITIISKQITALASQTEPGIKVWVWGNRLFILPDAAAYRGKTRIEVYNALGMMVHQENLQEDNLSPIDLNNTTSGYYIVRCVHKDFSRSQKVLFIGNH